MTLANSFHAFITSVKNGYQQATQHAADGALLAVSGGADSMALLHATVCFWSGHETLSRVAVAHINHGLRGAESDGDERMVREFAADLGVRCEVLRIQPGCLEQVGGRSLEEAARTTRYKFLGETASRFSFPCVVTAHHAADQVETVLHNIIRGTGLRGLRGMQTSRKLCDGVRLIRPLLNVSRCEVDDYLLTFGVPYHIDQSNGDLKFTRNRVRQQLLPLLKADFNSAVDRNLISLAEQAQQALDTMDALAAHILSEVVLESQADSCRLNRASLAKWPLEVVRHTLSLLWLQQAWPRQKMTFNHYDRMAAAVCAAHDSKEDLPGGMQLHVAAEIVRCIRLAKI